MFKLSSLFRRKIVDRDDLSTNLCRCLSTLDLCLLGLGHMIGGGIYVLTGQVAKRVAGPAVVLSFLLAGVVAVLAALCYAELGARAPRAGSAYTFIYMTLGELPAFLIGWQLIMEHLIGAAAVARTWSAYLDSLFQNEISGALRIHIPLQATDSNSTANVFGAFPDFPALGITLLVAIFVASGVRASASFNNGVTCVNLIVILFVLVYGLSFSDLRNWSPFFPFGAAGVFAGASRCFFAYVGFDSIAAAAEETSHPARSLPLATVSAMTIVTALYLLLSAQLTLMVPYRQVDSGAAFSSAFAFRGVGWAGSVVSAGAVAGITTALTGHLFTLPRFIYAMAEDGLLWSWLADVHPITRLPSWTVVSVALLAGVMALLLNTELLVDLLSIGTLSAYAIVSCSIIKLRYSDILEEATRGSKSRKINICILLLLLSSAVASATYSYSPELNAGVGTVMFLSLGVFLVSCWIISRQQQTMSNRHQSFQVPLVPVLPAASLFADLFLMCSLPGLTWSRLAIWLIAGLGIYCFYGFSHSNQRETTEDSEILLSEMINS